MSCNLRVCVNGAFLTDFRQFLMEPEVTQLDGFYCISVRDGFLFVWERIE